MKHLHLFLWLAFISPCCSLAQEWSTFPIPANAGIGKKWELQANTSDDFNYTFAAANQKASFGDNGKWSNFYHNQWDGPGTTYWKYNHVAVDGDNLVLKSSRWDKTNQGNPQYPYPGAWETYKMDKPTNGVNAGCVTSKNKVVYPVFVESAISVANISLASCFWLLSADDTQEIDIVENYGGVDGFKQFTHISHHSFVRSPFHDYQPKDWNSWWPDSRVNANYGWGDWSWNNGNRRYLRLGVYWISPNHFEYYVDGELVRVMYENAMATRMNGTWQYTYYNTIHPSNTQDQWGNNVGGQPKNITTGYQTGYSDVTVYATGTSYSFATQQAASNASKGINVVDPGNYQGGTGFVKELDIIINVESQSWLVSRNATPSDAELNNTAKNEMMIDWIRVYKPVNDPAGSNDRLSSLSFENLSAYIPLGKTLPTVQIGQNLSVNVKYATAIKSGVEEDLYYIATEIRLLDANGNTLKRTDFSVSVDNNSSNTGTKTYSFVVPTTFSDGSTIPLSSELDVNQKLLFTIFMSLDGDKRFEALNTSIDLVDNILGNKNTIETEYIIYPNPTKDVIHLMAETNWELLTLTGITLEQSRSSEVDMSNYSSGIYLLKVENKMVRIVKE